MRSHGITDIDTCSSTTSMPAARDVELRIGTARVDAIRSQAATAAAAATAADGGHGGMVAGPVKSERGTMKKGETKRGEVR